MNGIQELISSAEQTPEYWGEMAKLDFAFLLNESMDKHGVNRSQMAKKMGVSRAYMSDVLGGDATNFTLETMAKFMFALGERIHFSSAPIGAEKHNSAPKQSFSWTFDFDKGKTSHISEGDVEINRGLAA